MKSKNALKQSHTPGPWFFYDDGSVLRVSPVSAQDDPGSVIPAMAAAFEDIALIARPVKGAVLELSDAEWAQKKLDAALIAAAPELLESSKAFLEWFKNFDSNVYEEIDCSELKNFLAAIDKAEGK